MELEVLILFEGAPAMAGTVGGVLAVAAVGLFSLAKRLGFLFTFIDGDGDIQGLELLEEGLQEGEVIIDFRKELDQLVVRQVSPFHRLCDKGADHVSLIVRGHRLWVPFWS